ncbi:hypothetical protein [Nostoc sp.]
MADYFILVLLNPIPYQQTVRLSDLRQSRQEQHFQPLAGNEILNEFGLKLTPMSIAVPLQQMWFKYIKTAVNPLPISRFRN